MSNASDAVLCPVCQSKMEVVALEPCHSSVSLPQVPPAGALVPKGERLGVEDLREDLQRFDESRTGAVEVLAQSITI